jgi:hypothetical protein
MAPHLITFLTGGIPIATLGVLTQWKGSGGPYLKLDSGLTVERHCLGQKGS